MSIRSLLSISLNAYTQYQKTTTQTGKATPQVVSVNLSAVAEGLEATATGTLFNKLLKAAGDAQDAAAALDDTNAGTSIFGSSGGLLSKLLSPLIKAYQESRTISAINTFASTYNGLNTTLAENEGLDTYQTTLHNAIQPHTNALAAIGITLDTSKNMVVDQTKLRSAVKNNLSQLRQVLGSSTGVAQATAAVTESILTTSSQTVLEAIDTGLVQAGKAPSGATSVVAPAAANAANVVAAVVVAGSNAAADASNTATNASNAATNASNAATNAATHVVNGIANSNGRSNRTLYGTRGRSAMIDLHRLRRKQKANKSSADSNTDAVAQTDTTPLDYSAAVAQAAAAQAARRTQLATVDQTAPSTTFAKVQTSHTLTKGLFNTRNDTLGSQTVIRTTS